MTLPLKMAGPQTGLILPSAIQSDYLVHWSDTSRSNIYQSWDGASASSPVTADGQSVEYIEDLSGAGAHWAVPTGSQPGADPVWKVNIANGHGAVLADGTDDFMENLNQMVHGMKYVTCILALRLNSINFSGFNAGGFLGVVAGDGNSDNRFMLTQQSLTSPAGDWLAWGVGDGVDNPTLEDYGGTDLSTNNFHLFTALENNEDDEKSLLLDTVSVDTNTDSRGVVDIGSDLPMLFALSSNGAAANFHQFYFLGATIWASASNAGALLTGDDLQDAHTYFNTTFSLGI